MKNKKRFGDLFKTEWTEENKWRKFSQGMEEALYLLRYGKSKSEKQIADLFGSFKKGDNPFEGIF